MSKITIESGERKAIINIEENKDGKGEVTINYEPELDFKDTSKDMYFIANITSLFIEILTGGKNVDAQREDQN